jgi:broad specificity phosphatase PhoE
MHLYFIRHGESESNYGELITGQQDIALTERGREQAREAGKTIVAEGIHFDDIISSPLMRARDTAKLIAEQIGYPEEQIHIIDLLIERSFGSLEGHPGSDAANMTDEDIVKAGGEVDPQIRERAQRFLDSINGYTGNILLVSHTGFGRRLRAVIENIPTEQSQNFKNAELTDLGEVN